MNNVKCIESTMIILLSIPSADAAIIDKSSENK
jgi:hypothetical protein